MAGLAFAVVWVGYTTILYGYCLVKGYNVTPKQLLSPSWPAVKPLISGSATGTGHKKV